MSKRTQDVVIDLVSDDDAAPACIQVTTARKKFKLEPLLQVNDTVKTSSDDEVEVVAPPVAAIVPASTAKRASSNEAADDGEIVLLGAKNEQKLPHMRPHCPIYKFDPTRPYGHTIPEYTMPTITSNSKFCDLCYCFACDAPVKDCRNWRSYDITVWNSNHCCASDAVPQFATRRNQVIRDRERREKQERLSRQVTPAPRRPFQSRQTAASTTTTTPSTTTTLRNPCSTSRQSNQANPYATTVRNLYANSLSRTVTNPYERKASQPNTSSQNATRTSTPTLPARFTNPNPSRYPNSTAVFTSNPPNNPTPPPVPLKALPICDNFGAVNPLLSSGKYHLREYCAKHRFKESVIAGRKLNMAAIFNNESQCSTCFCYVCDVQANHCRSWRKPGMRGMMSNHCCATQENVLWMQERAKVSPGKPLKIDQTGPVFASGNGPFSPDHEAASQDEALTKCRKCGWYSRFPHQNFQQPASPTGSHDWCHRCGRVASEKDFGKSQSKPYIALPTDFYLGEKSIPFTLKAHDPRKFKEFKAAWEEEKDNWAYNEVEMEEELFRHRFGERPTLTMILASLPIREVIPETGFVRHLPSAGHRNAASETEALLVKEHNHKALLRLLFQLGTVGTEKYYGIAARGDIKATFDKETRSGTITIRLYLPKPAFDCGKANEDCGPTYGNLLGNWFDIYPFSLSSLCGALEAKVKSRNKATAEIRAMEQAAVDKFNADAKEFGKKLSLVSSSGSKAGGGICTDDMTLQGCLQRYTSETVAQESFEAIAAAQRNRCSSNRNSALTYNDGQVRGNCVYSDESWIELRRVASCHRGTNRGTTNSETVVKRHQPLCRLETFLTSHDAVLAANNLQQDLVKIVTDTSSMKGILEQLENIGHRSAEYVEGLNVELLGFQKQALQWALDRERSSDGIQSFWWAKLPGMNQDVYFNPILQRFRRDKPKIVKGGFIAQEMGLGKTLASLGLILSNPAPVFPPSGSNINTLDDAPSTSKGANTGWNDNLYSQTSADCWKRGHILSRGTLVVCPVSLVGQWVEEAKSKLTDPGLVYPYHGQSRDRNPLRLAENAIVVTTYQVLASDATYHAKKSGLVGYVPPLEQVRWWRIICDECHQMKMGNTKRSEAMMRLVSDHKWLVSGTPFNNSFNDLYNQLKFLGVEHAEDMMKVFEQSAYHHIGDPRKNSRHSSHGPCFGNLLFFLRSIMIRHTQKQTYRGTSTTLMSLPVKTERTLEIEFPRDESQHYAALEETARSFYEGFKDENEGHISRHYLMLTQKLNQIRIACSGGRYPLEIATNEKESWDDTENNEGAGKKRKKTKETVYSEFAFTAKLKALVKDLLATREENPTSKSLVFSQYNSTLQWLQEELPKHGFQFRTLTGSMSMKKRAKALSDFQGDPPTTIFLLSMRAGAVGINLTQANRVYLMEPSFNPALEDQAVGRVHRLGQKRPTLITRLVIKDSVETRLLQLRRRKQLNETVPKEEDTKPHASMPCPSALIGNVQTDRAAVLGEDFDLLYGVAKHNSTSSSFAL